jgi:regulator of protease activity HflC (stomatin/prohibitin superfamily)
MLSIKDKKAPYANAFTVIAVIAALCALGFLLFPIALGVIIVIACILSSGFTIIEPNNAKVITFFGKYVGTIKESGFLYTIPFSFKRTVPLKLLNFVTDRLKVNDLNGNPIEIGAVVVWRVSDAAQALLNIDDYGIFLSNQSDIAIRTLAAHYPYDSEKDMSLRGNIDEISEKLKEMLQEKLSLAGIIVEDTKLAHLAYAPEIAAAMLKRQQAAAVFHARRYMVENALAIIDDVIDHFDKKSKLKITADKKADLINSLLVVMTSDKEASPVLNVGD